MNRNPAQSVDPRWLRIELLFQQALDWSAGERRDRLAALEADATLVEEVLALLAASDAEDAANRAIPAPEPPAAPDTIGPYRVLRLAGWGGRGRVYEALREAAGVTQRVAIKVMQEHLISPEDLQRFEREQRMLLALNHPYIARFLTAGWDERQRPYMVMEWVDGDSLTAYVEKHGTPQPDRVRLILSVLDALEAAHRSLVVHLDLKPSNILVDEQGKVRVLDFGTAKMLGEQDTTSTQQMTPRYASPERLRGEPVTTACDIYSVGLLLHELVTRRWPFPDSSSIVGLSERAAGVARLEIATGHPDLDAILFKALEYDAARRYRSAAEFAADLRAFLDRRPVSARKPTLPYRLGRMVARHRLAFTVGALAAAALAAVAGYAVWQQQQRYREAVRAQQIAQFLRSMILSSGVVGSGRSEMTVAEMVARGSRRIAEGSPLPDDVAASIQADFAFLTSEYGREAQAEPMARDAVARADRSGDPAARVAARGTLAAILMRRGACGEAALVFETGDRLLREGGFRPERSADYLVTRASAKERCEAKPAEGLPLLEQAIRISESAPRASSAIAQEVSRAGLHLNYALLLARAGRAADALRACGAGIALARSHPDGKYFEVALLRIRSQAHSAAGDNASAMTDLREAARLAPGVVAPFEAFRLQTMLAGRMADAGDHAGAIATAEAALAAARARRDAVGPSFWMLVADAAEAMSKCRKCDAVRALYAEVDELTAGKMPPAWRGNRLFALAECAEFEKDPRSAASLAGQALQTYGDLLPAASKRRSRLEEILRNSPGPGR